MITASVVLYNTKKTDTRRIIECSINSIIDILYVVDNSLTDELRAIVEEYKSEKIIYLQGQGNVGYGEGNNIGINESLKWAPDYHLILNPDIIFKSAAIEKLKMFMDSHQDIGLCAPALTFTDGSFQASGMLLPSPFDILIRRFLPRKYVDKLNKEYEFRAYDLTKARNVPNICGCFFFMRVSTLKRVGLFDCRYFMYFEDFDLVRRFHKVSKTAYCPDATIIHAHGNEHRKNHKLLIVSMFSAIKYFNKWGWFFDSDRRKWNEESKSGNAIIE